MTSKLGRWKFYEEQNGNPIDGYDSGYLCSDCEFELPDSWYDDSEGYPNIHFCPNCGADMFKYKSKEALIKSCALDAQSDFSSDCIEISQAY